MGMTHKHSNHMVTLATSVAYGGTKAKKLATCFHDLPVMAGLEFYKHKWLESLRFKAVEN